MNEQANIAYDKSISITIVNIEAKGYPKEWKEYCKTVGHVDPSDFGFTDRQGDINRFAARYRAANQFRGITLDGYAEDTARGYGALFKVMLTWSAYETFEEIAELNRQEIGKQLEYYGAIGILNQIKLVDNEDRFYKFIYQRVNNKHKAELDNYFNQDPCNILYLASAIRHIFAHGWLSPNANSAKSKAVIEICYTLSMFLLEFMDREFSYRVDRFFDWFHNS